MDKTIPQNTISNCTLSEKPVLINNCPHYVLSVHWFKLMAQNVCEEIIETV